MTQHTEQNASVESSTLHQPTRSAVYVRLNEAEYRQLALDAEISDETLPIRLKRGYFGRAGGTTVLMAKADQRALAVAVARLGNNVNQIARALNKGGRISEPAQLLAVRDELAALNVFLRGLWNT